VRLRVEVAACGDRTPVPIAAGTSRIDVADLVELHVAAGVAAPAHEQVATCDVVPAERGPRATAVRQRTDSPHVHQALPEPAFVDGDLCAHCCATLRREFGRALSAAAS
jgi:hypothetical protein